ncbi:hypothetical protein PoB_006657500 [Plakobranchus ocellatus]|uniref:Uncharacterized protein n=1 Tax=Plakobranchus ocellatus TaxID=259542 RepID=A0AAV4D7P5_9GAST|nr:hypothetical protein PoB_006657500 [Plakobranchus ocellatus]
MAGLDYFSDSAPATVYTWPVEIMQSLEPGQNDVIQEMTQKNIHNFPTAPSLTPTPPYCSDGNWGFGDKVDSKYALKSAKMLLSQVRVLGHGGPKNLRSP